MLEAIFLTHSRICANTTSGAKMLWTPDVTPKREASEAPCIRFRLICCQAPEPGVNQNEDTADCRVLLFAGLHPCWVEAMMKKARADKGSDADSLRFVSLAANLRMVRQPEKRQRAQIGYGRASLHAVGAHRVLDLYYNVAPHFVSAFV